MSQRLGLLMVSISFLVACSAGAKEDASPQTPLPTSPPWGITLTMLDPPDGYYFDESKLSPFTDLIPTTWVTVSGVTSRYEIALQPQLIEVEACPFNLDSSRYSIRTTPSVFEALTPESSKTVYVYRKRVDVAVMITDLATGELLAESTFRGDKPQVCVGLESFQSMNGVPMSKTRLGKVNSEGFEAWLMDAMSALPALTAAPTDLP